MHRDLFGHSGSVGHEAGRWLQPGLWSLLLGCFSGIFQPGSSFWPRVATEHPPPLCWPSGMPLHRPQKPQEGVWETEDMGPSVGFQQASSELPPPGYALPGSGFPDTEPSQVGAWVEGCGLAPGHTGCAGLGLRTSLSGRGSSCCGGGSAALSHLPFCPGLYPQPASRPSSAREPPAVRSSQPAHGPVYPAGEPSPGELRGPAEPGPSAHRPDRSR